MATAEPEASTQGAQQVLSSASVSFTGCKTTAVPSIKISELKAINFTTYTWTLNQSIVTSQGVNLLPRINDSSSSGSGSNASSSAAPSASASAAAVAASASAAVNASASPYLSSKAPGVLVVPLGKDVSASVTLVTDITRLPGVTNGLYGLEGKVVVSAPDKEPLQVTGEAGCEAT